MNKGNQTKVQEKLQIKDHVKYQQKRREKKNATSVPITNQGTLTIRFLLSPFGKTLAPTTRTLPLSSKTKTHKKERHYKTNLKQNKSPEKVTVKVEKQTPQAKKSKSKKLSKPREQN